MRQSRAALVGSPNVGKSLLFNCLTGAYATVSNYPGTTIDILRARGTLDGRAFEITDTPGMYSLLPLTDEERVARRLLLDENPEVVVHVVDAKNIRRMLSLTLELMDAGLPIILDLNVMDEARQMGIRIDSRRLSDVLGIPVVETSAIRGVGLSRLKHEIAQYKTGEQQRGHINNYSPELENTIEGIAALLTGQYRLSKRMIALLLLLEDAEMLGLAGKEAHCERIAAVVNETKRKFPNSISYILAMERQKVIDGILELTVHFGNPTGEGLTDKLGRWTREPLTGIPALILVTYLGLYKFVGGFGAGVLVDYIDGTIFTHFITPIVEEFVLNFVPGLLLQSLLIGDYGIFSLGFRYAAAIILPVVGTFFLAFALLEDCGYLPRLAMLVDRLFKHFGLNGRAVIPIVLGFGCGTMAVMITRTLETRRERVLATFLLALTIPCSAQLGVVLALLSHNPSALGVWCAYMCIVFVAAGWLAARVLPGEISPFYLELPRLRIPSLKNVLTKAYTRMSWYFMEILPVFIATSVLMWLTEVAGILPTVLRFGEPLMKSLGLPANTAQVFFLGFFRRDYGAAGLYDMANAGALSEAQLLVAAVTMTLFVPCVAQAAVMVKERGVCAAATMIVLAGIIAFLSGFLVNLFLVAAGLAL